MEQVLFASTLLLSFALVIAILDDLDKRGIF